MCCRHALMKFSTEGISVEDHKLLLRGIQELPHQRPEHSLLPFLTSAIHPGGLCKAECINKDIVYILGTSAPACQLVKTATYSSCEILIAGEQLSAAGHLTLAEHSPHLNRFMLSHLAGSRQQKTNVRRLLRDLLKVIFSCLITIGLHIHTT
jgi:hypothetical protein